jgi:predicted metalloprotease with PDZ domain
MTLQMKNILLIFTLLIFSAKGFSRENDTIKVLINLKQVDSLGLRIEIHPPTDFKGSNVYQLPKSIPGIYEYLKKPESYLKLYQGGQELSEINSSYNISCDKDKLPIECFAKSTKNKYGGVYGEDFYFIEDSIYILNWHYLLGFFQNQTDKPYKIKIVKDKRLYGAGSLPKQKQNDTVDVFTAGDFKELIHNPIIYSFPDTTSFKIGDTKFIIACSGKDTILDSKAITDLIIEPLTEIHGKSSFEHEEYSFLYFSDYYLGAPYLTGLEHPSSTAISYHSALQDNNILISSSIHEYIHSIYAPLRIRGELINDFDFVNPKCDEFLWFYEGVTEYLTIKTLVKSGFFSPQEFFNELAESDKYHKNINLSKVSSNAYGKKEQNLFDNFYTKGSLFAFQLDLEIIKKSKGKTDLFLVMKKLQEHYCSNKPFNSETFINDFSNLARLDLQHFIINGTRKKTKIDFVELCNEIGYISETKDTVRWTFNIKKNHLITNYKKDRFEIAVFGSNINQAIDTKKVTIYKINSEPLTWFNYDRLLVPESGQEISFTATSETGEIEINVKPDKVNSEYTVWTKNGNYQTDLARNYWDK